MNAMNERPLSAIVLAAGEGTRMRSNRPKPLHHLCGRPMVLHVIDALAQIDVDPVVVVVGHRGEWVTRTLTDHGPASMKIEFVEQVAQRGTGDAVAVGLTGLLHDDDEEGDVVVLPGDTPLLRAATLAALVRFHRQNDAGATLLTAELADPTGYGRVVRGRDGMVARVVEEVDATEEERAVPRSEHVDLLLSPQSPRPVAAPAHPRQRAGRVLPDRRGRSALWRRVPGAVAGDPRPDGSGRSERPIPACGG